MTPKEKAEELIDKYINIQHKSIICSIGYAIECAKIAVDEIIDESHDYNEHHNYSPNYKFWGLVKKELDRIQEG